MLVGDVVALPQQKRQVLASFFAWHGLLSAALLVVVEDFDTVVVEVTEVVEVTVEDLRKRFK